MATKASGNPLQLTLATGAFAICFAVFGSVSALMPLLKKSLGLNAFQVSLAIAVPVLLGSLGRIPLGMLTDRYGGRLIFSLVMLCSIVPAFLMGLVSDYTQLILCGFFIGIALAVFSVGVSFCQRMVSTRTTRVRARLIRHWHGRTIAGRNVRAHNC